jgi:hypothetical protein
VSDSPSGHISNNRAVAGGAYNLRAISTGDTLDIGYAYDSWGSVLLTEGEAGAWFSNAPSNCEGTVPPPVGSCEDWYASNLSHNSAGRAYYSMGYYAVGSNDTLGAISGSYKWVRETASGYYEVGQCPN